MDELLLCARADWSLGYAGKGDFNIHDDARLTRRFGESANHVYAGVQIKLFGVELPGYWMHVGDPRAVIAAEAVLQEASNG